MRKQRSKLRSSKFGAKIPVPAHTDQPHIPSSPILEALHAGHLPPIEQMAPTVMQLQHTIGNQAVHKLLRSQRGAIQPARFIQRVETGLRADKPMTSFAGAVHQYASTNKDKSVESLVNFLNAQINAALNQLGVTPIVIEAGADSSLDGVFSPATWTIKLNMDAMFGGKTKIGEVSKSKLTNAVDTVYHEARHAEQEFRMARFRIGELLPPGASQDERDRVAVQVENELPVSGDIVRDAMKAPLYENPLADPDSVEHKLYDEARAWYVSDYGIDRGFRKIIMGAFSTAIEGMVADFKALRQARRAKNAADITKSEADITTKLQKCYDIRDGNMKVEILRLAKQSNATPEHELMLEQLRMMTAQLNFIESMGLNSRTQKKVSKIVDAVAVILDNAYRQLPAEADAFAAGEAITKKYKNAR